MSEVTRVLCAVSRADDHAAARLLPLIYDELRRLAAHKLAQEKPGHTLQPTALVHEAYLRLVVCQQLPFTRTILDLSNRLQRVAMLNAVVFLAMACYFAAAPMNHPLKISAR